MAILYTTTALAAPRPQMPAQFDAVTVQKLIDTIEKPPNAMILRVGYFMRRGAPLLPVEEGFALVQKAIEHEQLLTRAYIMQLYN